MPSPSPPSSRSPAEAGSGTDAAGTTVLESADGLAWRASSRDQAWQLEAVLWDGARFVAVGEQGAVLVATP